MQLDTEKKELTVDGEPVKLTPIEYKIIELFLNNLGRVFSIDEIYEKVWNEPSFNADNVVAVHIRLHSGKNRNQPKGAKIFEGGVGDWMSKSTGSKIFAVISLLLAPFLLMGGLFSAGKSHSPEGVPVLCA